MPNIRSPKILIPLIVVLLLVIAIPISFVFIRPLLEPQCSKETNFTGVIDSIDQVHGIVKLYNPNSNITPLPGFGRVGLIVTADASTRIFQQQGTACPAVSFSALKVGQRLKVWSRYEAIPAIYPTPITASDIVIVNQGT
jgi:hypothetical protein